MTTYAIESRVLDSDLLDVIERWHRHGTTIEDGDFEDLALRIFKYQMRYNPPYARYCSTFGYSAEELPPTWHDIPPIPATAFKEATLATFDVTKHAALCFKTSGTTQGTGGRHYMDTTELYDAALLAAFDRFMLPDREQLRYFNLVPNPAENPHSSLGYMMARISKLRGDGKTGWYVQGDDLLFEKFVEDIFGAIQEKRPVCIASTAFALVHMLDGMLERDLCFALPSGSRIMETGGFKGRSRIVERADLYADFCERFASTMDIIVAEYGMTELTSQYYDDVLVEKHPADVTGARVKLAPPWLRARVVGLDGKTLPNGTVGTLVHVDLANRSSCIAVQTEDLGVQFDEGLVLLGREQDASLRGCSLDAEELLRR